MSTSRHTTVELDWAGDDISESLARYAVALAYTDRLHGAADELSLTLLDRDLRLEDADDPWSGDARVQPGDKIHAQITVHDWWEDGDSYTLDCGAMVVDEVVYSAPPSQVSARATSVQPAAGATREARTRAWEATDLRAIAGDVAAAAGWRLVYDLTGAPEYDRVDQMGETDLDFVWRLAGGLGAIVRVWDGQLVVSDELALEARPPITTLQLGADRILGWRYRDQSHTHYGSCRVTYYDSWARQLITHTEGSGDPVLVVESRAKSRGEAISKAKGELSSANRRADESAASLSLVGDPRLCAGCTVSVITGTGLDGLYIVTEAQHRVGSGGYTTELTLRKTEA